MRGTLIAVAIMALVVFFIAILYVIAIPYSVASTGGVASFSLGLALLCFGIIRKYLA